MNPEQWQKIEGIFQQGLAIEPSRRPAFLDNACSGDNALRREVESLMTAHEQAGAFLETPAVEQAMKVVDAASRESFTGRVIGPYRIIHGIGAGGMGDVYLAERADDQYRKQVAIKLIKPHLANGSMLQRFHIERQILANLDHPNIARLLDGGTTEDGIPYIVMDYIEGIPIDTYCDQQRLKIDRRLELFRTICSAVHYAHQNLVIHQDIKHGNILVTKDGIAKLLDFGIAKLLYADSSDEPDEASGAGLRLMTLDYASPEQVRDEAITTASDVYSLGVLLYRLLTGHQPYRLRDCSQGDVVRIICEEEPEKPSLLVDRLHHKTGSNFSGSAIAMGDSISRARREKPAGLRRRLRGDLDAITLMSMRKAPRDRYTTAEQFSEDIRRHLEGLPVLAHPDAAGYRVRKFIGRHFIGVAAASLILMTLIGGIVTTTRQAGIAERERDKARIEAEKAEEINAFVQDMLSSADPRSRGKDVTVAEVLDEAARRVETELKDQPEIAASAQTTIGLTYLSLGSYEAAESQLHKALRTRLQLFGIEHPDVAISMNNLATVFEAQGNLAAAEPLLQKALAILRRTDRGKKLGVADVLNNMAELLFLKGNLSAAEQMHREELDIRRASLGNNHPAVAQSLNDLAVVLGTKGDWTEAEKFHREALAIIRKVHGPEHPDVASALSNLASDLVARKEYAAAEPLYIEALELRRKLLGNEHPDVTWILYNYAMTMVEKGDFAKARDLARQVLALRGKSLPEEHPMVAGSLLVLGRSLMGSGDPQNAERLLRESLELRRKNLPVGHWLIANTESVLGECLTHMSRFHEAEPLVLDGYSQLKKNLGDQHERTHESLQRIVQLYDRWKKPDQAARYRALLSKP